MQLIRILALAWGTAAALSLLVALWAGVVRPAPAVAATSGNPVYDALRQASVAERNGGLGHLVGPGCSVAQSFDAGLRAAGDGIWDVRCRDRRAFSVRIPPRDAASVVPCTAICFAPR